MLKLLLLGTARALLFPEQLHLSWTENPQEMRVTWLSPLSVSPQVSYRIVDDETWTVVEADSERENFGVNLPRYSYVNTGVMGGLENGKKYEYKVNNGILPSDVFSFQGRTPGTSDNSEYSVVIYGDLGISDQSYEILDGITKELNRNPPLFIVHLGDLGYNLDQYDGYIGDWFGNMIEDVAGTYAYMTVAGNHERNWNFTHYSNRYLMPKNDASKDTSLFYSLDVGFVHHIFINTNVFKYGEDAEMETHLNWLEDDLKKANENRNNTPWIVGYSHHPLYCAYNQNDSQSLWDCRKQSDIMRDYLEELYYENNVDLIVSGHVHNYQRNSPIYNDSFVHSDYDDQHMHINAKAPVYIISGNGGNDKGGRDIVVKTEVEWSMAQSYEFGFGRLSGLNRTHLLWQQYSSEREDTVIDYVYLIKSNS